MNDEQGRAPFWIGLALGLPVMVFGVAGALDESRDTKPATLARWVVGAAVVHDLLWAPAVVLVAWATARRIPAHARGAVRIALASTALLAIVSWPLVRGYGRRPATPSALPLDYTRNVLALLGAIWAAAAVVVVVRSRRAARQRTRSPREFRDP